jgi:acetone carboxylase gamma subunit
MKIVDSEWTPQINWYIILCDCGKEFKSRTDRWKVTCPFCYKIGNTEKLRDEIQPGQMRIGE